jgi:ADP-ribose pyrophosphatase YjhB (NUDIX family)
MIFLENNKHRLNRKIKLLQKEMQRQGIDTTQGLPESLFLFSTTLAPVSNVDLFVADNERRILLSWRNDPFYGAGWHIPGGCIRLKETMVERIQRTAQMEIGSPVIIDERPIAIKDLFVHENRHGLENQLERCHNISILFHCTLPDGFIVNNGEKKENESGYLKWFSFVPDNLLSVHHDIYGDILKTWFLVNK